MSNKLREFLTAVTLAICAFSASSAAWARQPDDCSGGPGYHIPVAVGPCESANAPQESICWYPGSFTLRPGIHDGLGTREGFPLNVNLWWGVGPPDYAPVHKDLGRSPAPLVNSVDASYRGPNSIPERATAGGLVDLMTGTPLISETDLELPFGGAMFRHVRTYGEVPSIGLFEQERPYYAEAEDPTWRPYPADPLQETWRRVRGTARENPASELYWDWQGIGWMMSENPIFLFDAAYWGVVADGNDETPVRCYFIPDAHRSIPFERRFPTGTSAPVYVAPDGFDAVMSYSGGQWNSTTKTWTVRPTSFKVWLFHGAIRYDIQLQPGDVGPTGGSIDYHAPPTGPNGAGGYGVPHWGLVTAIEDRYGNRMEMEHCPRQQTTVSVPTLDCYECAQNCQERGQLRSVRLYAAAEPNVAKWTLVYTHREFLSAHANLVEPLEFLPIRNRALHSLHVYEGDRALTGLEACLTIPDQYFNPPAQGNSRQILEALDAVDAGAIFTGLPTDWTFKLQYLYTDPHWETNPQWAVFYKDVFGASLDEVGTATPRFAAQPRLLKTTIMQRKVAGSDDGMSISYKVNRYADPKACARQRIDEVVLSGTFGPAKLDTMVEAIRQSGVIHLGSQNPTIPESIPDATVNNVLLLTNVDLIAAFEGPEQALGALIYRPKHLLDVSYYYSGSHRCGPGADCDARQDLIENYFKIAPGDRARVAFIDDGHRAVNDSRGSRDSPVSYRIYRYLFVPAAYGEAPGQPIQHNACSPFLVDYPIKTISSCSSQISRALYHYPYRFIASGYDLDHVGFNGLPDQWVVPEQSEALWLVVVDEHRRVVDSDEVVTPEEKGRLEEIVFRHTYRINARGYILQHQTWKMGTDGGLVASEGTAEEFEYDSKDRITERRTVGWGSPENISSRETDGLIYVYEYPPAPAATPEQPIPNAPRQIARVGIKQGASGTTTHWISSTEWNPHRPDQIAKEKRFKKPTTDYTSIDPEVVDITEYSYLLGSVHEPGTNNWRSYIAAKTTTRPAAESASNGTTCLAIDQTIYDNNGHTIWQGAGRVLTGTNSQPVQFYWNKMVYDPDQSDVLVQTIVDASQPAATAYTRIDPLGAPARTLTTSYFYEADKQVRRVDHPSGRTDLTFRKSTMLGLDVRERWTFTDLVDTNGSPNPGSDTFIATSSARIETVRSSRDREEFVREAKLAQVTGQVSESSPASTSHTVYATITPAYDGAGKMVEAEVSAAGVTALTASVWYNGFGNAIRTRAPDGTITRVTHDGLGRVERTYRGTNDSHFAWGTAEPNSAVNPCDYSQYTDNLALVSSQSYGLGTHDALKPTVLRHYRDQPIDRYFQCDPPVNNEEQIGWAEVHKYDWRMRKVMVEHHSSGDLGTSNIVRQEVTWLDHADRTRFSATYGSTALNQSIDPVNFDISSNSSTDGVPSAATILGAVPHPLALTEVRYSNRGDVEETRQYDVSDVTGDTYTRSRTFFDHAGRPLVEVRPDGAEVRNVYDYAGRVVRRSVFGASLEVERTDTTYDAGGNATRTDRFERIPGSTAALTSSGASVRSVVFNWFDPANRLVASAEFGTCDDPTSSDQFRTGSSNPDWAVLPSSLLLAPALTVAQHVALEYSSFQPRVTAGRFDVQGRRIESVNERGTLTTYAYDDLGRLILQTDNASVETARRRTAYFYDAAGRLAKIAALRPYHVGPVNWSLVSSSKQVTEMLFDAKVHDTSGTEISRNNEWVSAVKFPSVPCPCDFNGGGLSLQDLFDFIGAYFGGCMGPGDPDSSCIGSADFNNSGAVSVQDIFDFLTCYFAGCSTGWNNSAGDLQFTYLTDGLVRNRASIEGGTFTYAYDTLSRLTNIGVSGVAYEGSAVPADSVRQVNFVYDSLSRLTQATAAADAGATGSGDPYTVASNLFEYDGLGNLVRERAAFGQAATGSSPAVEYGWSPPTAAAPFSRLTSMTMPVARAISGGTARRETVFDYGQADITHPEDHLLGRVRDVRDVFNSQTTTLARFGYIGESRRAGIDRGVTFNGSGAVTAVAVSQGFGVGSPVPVISGLDRFGRTKDLKYVGHDLSDNALTLFEGQYGYDASGNRTRERLTYVPFSSTGTDGLDRSWLYTYDAFDRLKTANAGRLTSAGAGFETPATTTLPINRYRQVWGLDDLGNFGFASFNGQTDGRLTSKWWGLADTTNSGSLATRHYANERNELLTRRETMGEPPDDNTSTPLDPVATDETDPGRGVVYDKAGRVVFDGTNVFRYDAWGRVVEVNELGGASVNGQTGQVTGTLGALVVHYSYDALGRLIARQTPWNSAHESVRIERFHHDGARRVQELVSTEVNSAAALPLDSTRWASGLATGLGWSVDREYVHVPSAAGGYVDEYLCQFDGSSTGGAMATGGVLSYILQDANYNVVSVSDTGGHASAQYAYYPYGVVKHAELFDNTTGAGTRTVRIGHQGLFYDRFDAPWESQRLIAAGPHGNTSVQVTFDGEGNPIDQPLVGRGVYQNRNRTYDPAMGRFVQRDPNGSGAPTSSLRGLMISQSLVRMYGTGLNLALRTDQSPLSSTDPTGLDPGFSVGGQMAVQSVGQGAERAYEAGAVAGIGGYTATVGASTAAASAGMGGGVGGGFGMGMGVILPAAAKTVGGRIVIGLLGGAVAAAIIGGGRMAASNEGGGGWGKPPSPPPDISFPEDFESAEAAFGPFAFGGLTLVTATSTSNTGLRAAGFTETLIYESNMTGERGTIHRNPKTNKYRGAHLSDTGRTPSE